MKLTSVLSLHPLAIAGAALLLLTVAPTRARAVFVFTLSQTGGNVVVNGGGTLNISSLNILAFGSSPGDIDTGDADLLSGPAVNSPTLYFYGLITGPSSFGTATTVTFANSGSGSYVGISEFALSVPSGYQSGTPLITSSTYSGATFNSLGFIPGTYTYTWGTGANADSLTVTSVVPEPSTWAFLFVGGVSLLGRSLRRRQAYASTNRVPAA